MKLLHKRLSYGLVAAAMVTGGLALAPGAQAATTAATAHSGTVTAAGVHADYSSTSCGLVSYKNSDISVTEWVPNHNLSYGDNGDYCVRLLQRGIDEIFGDPSEGSPLTVDGNFGPQTEQWVKTFQSDFGCSQGVDGQAGPNTNSCLQFYTGTYDPT
ncbi:peptidoglycan-binding protein [Streptacidiphilus sp. PB12-B1b]|uniref:peptidoglycan-binding domain-containing protein n=1 Tax=Streptacidiphilus sp. PB12-B1b TaxID=2705012 RepID=UPI0015F9AD89|nr:peptidoglycan-binding domain-containing protein [Streptacidiphilus sp. PB12-B1b]QMU77397.1 peptidoglycan-binding protein [Streptacidiphilus sp. PB12-B1b]